MFIPEGYFKDGKQMVGSSKIFSETIPVKVKPDQKQYLIRKAEEAGKTLGQYCREDLCRDQAKATDISIISSDGEMMELVRGPVRPNKPRVQRWEESY